MELKKINILSLAKITTLFGLIGGTIISLVLAILKKVSAGSITSDILSQYPALATVANFTLKSALLVIVQYTIVGFIWGAVIALIYNLVARWVGGIKLEFAEKKK